MDGTQVQEFLTNGVPFSILFQNCQEIFASPATLVVLVNRISKILFPVASWDLGSPPGQVNVRNYSIFVSAR